MKETTYMSKEYTNSLRGICAIVVVVHHLYQRTGLFSGTHIGTLLQLSGFLAVAVFFFFSGYGLMCSSKKRHYIDQFLEKRFLPLYCLYILLIVLYTLWTLLLEKDISYQSVIQSFFWGKTIVANGWYLQATFISYLFFFLMFRIFKSPKIQILSFSGCILVYCVCCHVLDMSLNWYHTIPCMVLGMVYCFKKDFIDTLLKKFAWIILALSGILFATSLVLSFLSSIDVIFDMMYSLFFVCTVITLSYILCSTPILANKFTALLGKYSLEIYISHGFFLMLRNYITNVWLYIGVVIIGTILTSILMKKLYQKIVATVNNITSGSKHIRD